MRSVVLLALALSLSAHSAEVARGRTVKVSSLLSGVVFNLKDDHGGWTLFKGGLSGKPVTQTLKEPKGERAYHDLRDAILEAAQRLAKAPVRKPCQGELMQVELTGLPAKKLPLCLAVARDYGIYRQLNSIVMSYSQ